MRVVVIGAGFGAAIHAPNVRARDDLRLVGICDSGSGHATAVVAAGEAAFHDWRTALQSIDSGAVIIATPPAYHEEIALAAIERGLHVLLEKPAGIHADSARRVAQAAHSVGVVAGVNFQFRFEPLLERMREAVVAGDIGALRAIEISWRTGGRASSEQRADWRHFTETGGGVLRSHVSHVFDMIPWFGGGGIASASGYCDIRVATRLGVDGEQVAVDAEDQVFCRFRTSRNVLGYASVSNVQPGGEGLCVRVLGEQGVAVFRHVPPFRFCDQRMTIRRANEDIKVEQGEAQIGDTRIFASARLLQHFVEAVHDSTNQQLPTVDDAVAALEAIEQLTITANLSERGRQEGH